MRIRSILLAATVVMATPVVAPVLASPWAEVGDNQLRSDIELLAAAGVIDGITTHWPLPWRSLATALGRVNLDRQPLSVRAAAERVIARAQHATRSGLNVSAHADATNMTSVVYGLTA